jgi:hypothetical protein
MPNQLQQVSKFLEMCISLRTFNYIKVDDITGIGGYGV